MIPGERGITPPRPDYFLSHRPTQPKREVADYVESQGILVPQRFADLNEARSSGKPFIVRSEHPQDYDGASGVFSSLVVSPSRIVQSRIELTPGRWDLTGFMPGADPRDYARLVLGIGELTQEDLEARLLQISSKNAEIYCRYAGIPFADFIQQVSYSYWESIPGVNRAVIADSSISGRYHISSAFELIQRDPDKEMQKDNYLIIENGLVVGGTPQNLTEDRPENIKALIEAYENVRNFGRFAPDNCPMIEFQSDGSEQYFLQYLRGRDFKAPEFAIDRDPEGDEIQSMLTIGATPAEGLEVGVTYIVPRPNVPMPDTEATLNYFVHPMFVEALVRKAGIQIVSKGHPADVFAEDQGHLPRSVLFKPEMTLLFLRHDLKKVLRGDGGYPEVDIDPGTDVFRVRIVSDGRKAYLKRIA